MADLLLVDNDRRIAELCAWFLENAGHRVRIAASYAEARARLAERAPDLLLADLELGAESGREELPRLAAEGLLPPTLIVSGYLDRELERELFAVGPVRGALSKPFDARVLLERVEAELSAGPRGTESPATTADLDGGADGGWIEIVPRGGHGRGPEGVA